MLGSLFVPGLGRTCNMQDAFTGLLSQQPWVFFQLDRDFGIKLSCREEKKQRSDTGNK